MILRERIEEIVQNLLDDEIFIIDISVSGSAGRQKITVVVDGDNGITIDKCAWISRKLGNEIESKELVDQNYILEVSSPGIDQPLSLLRQYKRNIGRKVRIQLDNNSLKLGTLKEVKDEAVIIDEEVPITNRDGKVLRNKKTFQEVQIPFKEIKKTNVIISFS